MAVQGGYGQAAQFQAMASAAERASFHIGRVAGNVVLLQAALQVLAPITRAFGELEQSLTLTQSVAQATSREFKQMEKAARDFALGMRFSATEASNAMYFLASAGFSVQQSLSAMNGVMNFAQATMSDVAQSADMIAGAIMAFGLTAKDATRVSNLFAASISVSQATSEKLAYSMRQVAPVAKALGNTIEETTAQLSILYNVGLRGEQAGTALRNSMVRLINPTAQAKEVFDQMGVSTANFDGSARKLNDILVDISKINPDNFTIKMLVEDEALAGMQALLQAANPDEFLRKLSDSQFAERAADIARRAGKDIKDVRNEIELMELAIINTNSASRMAQAQTTTLAGSFSLAKNSLTELAISVGQTWAPALQSAANTITSLGIAFRGLNDDQQKFIGTAVLLVPALYGVVKAAQAVSAGLLMVGTAYTSVRTATAAALGLGAVSAGAGVAGAAGGAAAGAAAGGAATKVAAALGGVGGIITILGGAAGIGMLLYYAWPSISKFLSSSGRETSSIPQINMGDTLRQRAQSIMLAGGTPLDQRNALAEQKKVLAESEKEWERWAEATKKTYTEVGDGLKKTFRQMLDTDPGGVVPGMRQMWNRSTVNDTTLDSLAQRINAFGGEFGEAPRNAEGGLQGYMARLRERDRETFDSIVRFAKERQKMRADLNNLQKNMEGVGSIDAELDRMIKTVESNPAFLKSAADADREKFERAAQFSFVRQDFILDLRKDMRAKELEVDKARLELMRDPAAEFIVSLMVERERSASAAITQAEARAAKIAELFGNLPMNLKNIVTGKNFRDFGIVTETNAEGKEVMRDKTDANAPLRQGWLELFQQGASPDEVREAARVASDAIKARIPAMAQNVRAVYAEANTLINEKLVEAILEEMQIARQKAFGDQLQRARGNSVFVRQMREVLLTQQLDFVKQVTAGAASVTTGFAFANELNDAFAGLQQSNNRMIDQITAFWTRFDPTESIEKGKEQVEKFSKTYTEQMNAMYRVRVRDIIDRAKMAREKMADEIRVASSAARAQKSSIMSELFVLTNLSGEFRDAAIGNELDKINADADRKIADLNDQIRQLRYGIMSARMARGELSGVGAIPTLQVPTSADAETTVHRNNVENILSAIRENTARMAGIPAAGGAAAAPSRGIGSDAVASASVVDIASRSLGAYLGSKSENLNPVFADLLKQLMSAIPGLEITSGFRTFQRQQELFEQYGPGRAAAPGTSRHEKGMAADLIGGTYEQIAAMASQLGLRAIRSNGGAVHVELANTRALVTETGNLAAARREVAMGTQQASVQEQAMVIDLSKAHKVAGDNVKTWADLEQAMRRAGIAEDVIRSTIDGTKAAIDQQIAGNEKRIRQSQELVQWTARLRDEQLKYADTPGMRAYREWQLATAANEAYGKSIERNGSIVDGFKFQHQKMTLQLMTDSQLAAQVFQQGVEGVAGVLAGLISGTTKDWRQALSQLAQQIAQTILKALIMRAILGVFGGSGAPMQLPFAMGGIPVIPNAKGNAYGSFVNSKQYFPMAGGRVGSIAEMGSPEAIMPLARSGGRLGVYEASTGQIVPLRRGYGGKLGVDIANQGGTTPIIGGGGGRGGGGGGIVYQSQFNFNGGGAGEPSFDRTQQENMKREMDREVETAVLRVFERHSRAGGVMNPNTRRA